MNTDWKKVESSHPCSSVLICGSRSLNQFDVVAKRVAAVEAVVAGVLGLFLDRQPSLLDFFPPTFHVVHFVRQVRPRRGAVDVFLDADVRLETARVEPEAMAAE